MSRTSNPWTTLSTRTAYESGWLALEDRRVRDAAGRERPYAIVRFKHVGIRMLPIDNAGFTYLVGQHRYAAADYYSWELPAGGAEPGEDFTETARRELGEEVGLTAEHWLQVLDMMPSGSLTDERQIGFVAWGFERTERDPDSQEVLSIDRVPFRALSIARSTATSATRARSQFWPPWKVAPCRAPSRRNSSPAS